ncbi:MAG: LPP20 family lipoprotein, partial [Gammaproteobacteria bacterium]|nr:LPP20 family lipoprotein [Gammaproteobacteria bacterium]
SKVTLTMKLIYRLKILLCTFLLTACMQSTSVISSSDAPEWVNTEPGMYPNIEYLSATGSASNAEQAKARALSNLAKIFEVQIREVSTTTQDTQSHRQDGIESVASSARIASTVNLKTDKMVQGARIAEQWQNSEDLSYYALAVLDRTQAGNNIRGEMSRLDEETQYALNQESQRNDPLLRISDLHKTVVMQKDRQALQKMLKIIDLNGTGSPAQWNLAELDEQLQQSLRALPLQTAVKIDDVGGLLYILQGAVSEAGFNIGNSGYQLTASLDAQAPIQRGGWYWLRATLKIELIAEDRVTVIGYQSWPLKVSASNPSELNARMLNAVDTTLKNELLNSILEFST